MGAVVSKKKLGKKEIKSTKNTSFEVTQSVHTTISSNTTSTTTNNNNNNNNALQQYIEDEEGLTTFLSVNSKNNYVNNSSSSALSSAQNIKSQERLSSYMDQYYHDLESFNHHMHHTTSFVLPENWESKEYQYQLHFSLKTLFNGNVAQPVAPLLKKGARIIQMGTCSGPWIMDMATHYPECSFIGIELATHTSDNIPPLANVKFERGNIFEDGLDLEDNSIDYIHLRSVGSIICTSQWPLIFNEINRILKPEGVIRIEELEHSPTGTVMIESFIETVKAIFYELDQDADIAIKYGDMLKEYGFEVLDQQIKRVHYASDGKLSNEFVSAILNMYMMNGPALTPKLGLDLEDYRHRVETICTECVRKDSYMEWYSWVAKKPRS